MKYILIAFATVLIKGLAFADAIHDAAAKGDLRSVQLELDRGVNPNAKNGTSTAPPLLLAALNSHAEVIKLLVAQGAELDGKDKFGNTSLHYASQRGSKDIVKLLISNKANINTKNKGGETPLDIAANEETADILRYHNGIYGTFIGAVTAGDLNAIMMFLNAGVDVNQKIQHGWTALHETAVFGNTEAAKLLISKGANINAWDGYETPLDVSDKESDYAKFLRENGGMTGKELKTQGK